VRSDFDLHYFTSVFLITHPMYVPTTELLRRIFDVYEAPATPFPGGADDPRVLQQRVRTRVLEVLKKWVEEFFSDFKAGCEAREVLDTWITQQAQGTPPTIYLLNSFFISLLFCFLVMRRISYY
jgi:hypothetical protein